MAYWLFKSEPNVFSWEDLAAKGKAGEEWTGVRNYQARNNMRAMKLGEKGFLYVEVDVGGRRVPIVNLHLHYRSKEHRFVQTDRLLAWMRDKQGHHRGRWAVPPIVCGDLNNPGHRSDATAALLSHLSDYCDYTLQPTSGRTFPSPLPSRLLDFVFMPEGCDGTRSEIVRSFLSDHRPVVVDFGLKG